MTKTNRCLCLNIPFLGYRCFQNKTLDTKSSSPTGIKTKFYLKRWEGFMLNVFTGQYSLRKEVHKFHDKGNTEDGWHSSDGFCKAESLSAIYSWGAKRMEDIVLWWTQKFSTTLHLTSILYWKRSISWHICYRARF